MKDKKIKKQKYDFMELFFLILFSSCTFAPLLLKMEKLKQRWGIKSNWQIIAILLVFSLNGSFAVWVAKPITAFFGLSSETTSLWIYIPLRVLLIFPIYQLTLPIVGWFFGQFKFFWEFEKKMLNRMGFGRFFKKDSE